MFGFEVALGYSQSSVPNARTGWGKILGYWFSFALLIRSSVTITTDYPLQFMLRKENMISSCVGAGAACDEQVGMYKDS